MSFSPCNALLLCIWVSIILMSFVMFLVLWLIVQIVGPLNFSNDG